MNEKGIENLGKLVESLGDVQKQASNTLNTMITDDIRKDMTDEQNEMMNELKGVVNLEGCKDLSAKLDEIQGALKKYNL